MYFSWWGSLKRSAWFHWSPGTWSLSSAWPAAVPSLLYLLFTASSLHTFASISIKGILCIIYTVIKYLQATFQLSPSRLHSAEAAVWQHAQLVTFAGIPHRAETLHCPLTGKHMHPSWVFFPFFLLAHLNSYWQLVLWVAVVIVSIVLSRFSSSGISFALWPWHIISLLLYFPTQKSSCLWFQAIISKNYR